MAIMIPRVPHNFKPESREGDIFVGLQKLPDDYYVFHSFKMIRIINESWKEAEVDFVVFNKKKGLLCIEAKAGQVYCEEGIWKYGSGDEMKHDPFYQAHENMRKLSNNIMSLYGSKSLNMRMKRLSCVWFPSLTNKDADRLSFPMGCDRKLVMTGDDLANPLPTIERIFSYNAADAVSETNLYDSDVDFLMMHVLCPTFKIIPKKTLEIDYKHERFDDMIKEQSCLLDYLEMQRSAVINGAAGTGKTMIAIEKARRHSVSGETVLFLCFNAKLKEYLESTYKYNGVKYYTLPAFAMSLCHTSAPDYEMLVDKLMEFFDNPGEFPYTHIIVDEGQDFAVVDNDNEDMKSDEVFEALETITLEREKGIFYIFYDKNQLVQGKKLPNFIADADCKLTLYKNCRNTQKIADTSVKPLIDFKPKLIGSALEGTFPEIIYLSNSKKKLALDKAIGNLISKQITNIQILSCAAEGHSSFDEFVDIDNMYNYRGMKIPFTTCRKFKGLEADTIVMVDVNKKALMDNAKVFYVGTSRARLELKILADLSDDDCADVVKYLGSSVKRKNPSGTLANLLGCDIMEI